MKRWLMTVAAAACAGVAMVPTPAAAYEPSAFEQYQLELLNRARANPTAEVTRLSGETWGDNPANVPGTAFPQPQPANLNEGLPANTITTAAKQPLAFNLNLITAARDYSQTLLDNDAFDHNFGGTTPTSRMQAAGYSFTPLPAGSGENLAATGSTGPHTINTTVAGEHHSGLFVDNDVPGRGHRTNMMSPDWREVGIGMAAGPSEIFGSTFNTAVTTQDFAFTGGNPFLTGVVFTDAVTDDAFYTPGEGLDNVTITAVPVGGGAASIAETWISGGYSLRLAAGEYAVSASGPFGVVNLGNVVIGSQNVKRDIDTSIPEPGSLALLAVAAAMVVKRRGRRA